MDTILRTERLDRLDAMIPRKGSALDLGCGNHLRYFYGPREFERVVAVNAHRPTLEALQNEFQRDGWDFLCMDITEYNPTESFDVITALHVVEHLKLDDLAILLDKLVLVGSLTIIETPEQFDDNKLAVVDRDNPWELHRSLVTAEFLSDWGFVPVFRYWQNEKFSNAVYTRGALE